MHRLDRSCDLNLGRGASQLACSTSNRMLERHERWGSSRWGSLRPRGAWTGYGHILRGDSFILHTPNLFC